MRKLTKYYRPVLFTKSEIKSDRNDAEDTRSQERDTIARRLMAANLRGDEVVARHREGSSIGWFCIMSPNHSQREFILTNVV